MAIKERRRLSLEAFAALPEEKPALELAPDGTVTQKVSPKAQHSRLQAALIKLFDRVGQPKKLAMAFPELRVRVGVASYVPDVAVYRWERIRHTPDGEVSNDPPDPPDIAVEIVSPEQSAAQQLRKCVWYVEHGVSVSLLVDPADRTVLLFRAEMAPIVLRDADKIEIRDVLPGFEVPVKHLFGALRIN